MAVLHVVLRNDALICDAFLIQEIRGYGLLKERVTDIFLVCLHKQVDTKGMQFLLPGDASLHQGDAKGDATPLQGDAKGDVTPLQGDAGGRTAPRMDSGVFK